MPASWQDWVLTKQDWVLTRSGVAQMYCKNALKRARSVFLASLESVETSTAEHWPKAHRLHRGPRRPHLHIGGWLTQRERKGRCAELTHYAAYDHTLSSGFIEWAVWAADM